MNIEKIKEKLEEIARGYDPGFDAGEYWDSGNFDDCFQSGVDQGENNIKGKIQGLIYDIENET